MYWVLITNCTSTKLHLMLLGHRDYLQTFQAEPNPALIGHSNHNYGGLPSQHSAIQKQKKRGRGEGEATITKKDSAKKQAGGSFPIYLDNRIDTTSLRCSTSGSALSAQEWVQQESSSDQTAHWSSSSCQRLDTPPNQLHDDHQCPPLEEQQCLQTGVTTQQG